MTSDITFHIGYREKGVEDMQLNPRVNIRIEFDDVSIPSANSYHSTFELPFWLEIVRILSDICEVSEHARSHIVFDNGAVLLFKRIDHETVEITNLYTEDAINDKSERLGIENSATVSLEELSDAVLEQVQSTLRRIRRDHPEADDNRIQLIKGEIQKLMDNS